MKLKRLISVLIFMVLLCSFAGAFAEGYAQARPTDQFVRVLLTRLELKDRIDLTFKTSYLLESDSGVNAHFQADNEISFILQGNEIFLYYRGLSMPVGSKVSLSRTDSINGQQNGFQKTNYPTEYLGDLTLDIQEGKLRPILKIHVEDYLLGVVPYEMGNDFPLEALKAQAVAARTYALRSRDTSDDYDVYDNTNDQVFRGYIAGNERSEQAVTETAGICGFYKGQLAQCFYSASNGGQTEEVQTVWPNREDLRYYAFGEDPYDLENPASTVKSMELMKEYQNKEAPVAVREMLLKQISAELVEKGYDATTEGIRIDKITSVKIDTPDRQNSKRMTRFHLEAEISVRKIEPVIAVVDHDTEEVFLFAEQSAQTSQSNETFRPIVTAEPTPEAEVGYGPFVKWDKPVNISTDVFPEAEKALSLSINSNYANEIWCVTEHDDRYTVEVRRFGHGVGMSQRGAQTMAEKYEKTFEDILAFYYPGMDLKQYPEQERIFVQAENALVSTAGPAPSPTPRPTLMPATVTAEEGQWYAKVTEISDDSSLNLRAEPSLNCEILMRLYKGQRLLVVERCVEEGWVKVRTDVVEGYVMEKYLTSEAAAK